MSDTEPRRRGGQPGNKNSLVNGSRLRRLTVGELPREMLGAKSRARSYRRALEAEALARHREVSIDMAHTIDLATQAEMQVAICQWILRNRLDKLSATDLVTVASAMTKAKETRNKAVRTLDLSGSAVTAAKVLYSLSDDEVEPTGLLGPANGHSQAMDTEARPSA